MQFRHVVVWPLRLMAPGAPTADFGALFVEQAGTAWKLVDDEYTGDPAAFQERHYSEFVAFLPPVQRFLYGQGLGRLVTPGYGESPVTTARRTDVHQVRLTLAPLGEVITLDVAHIDLYFFVDIPLAMLAMEVVGHNMTVIQAQESMYQFGRAYPAYWEADGSGGHCPLRVEWLSGTGETLATSDYEDKRKYLETVCRHRAPAIATHWEFLLSPLVIDHADQAGGLRFRLLEYNNMPLLTYLAMSDVNGLTRADRARFALASGSAQHTTTSFSDQELTELEARFGYAQARESRGGRDWGGIHHTVSGHALVVIGPAGNPFFVDAERGYLARFRHQHFLAFLIAHFHRATLLMLSDWLSVIMGRLVPADLGSTGTFRTDMRSTLEVFLRFSHRYWFHDIADHVQTRDLFNLLRHRLRIDELFVELRQELQDMNQYLEGDVARRQNNSMVRLTVVTTLGLIGTVTTGLLGMNLIDWSAYQPLTKVLLFVGFFTPVSVLVLLSVVRSSRLSVLLDRLSDEKVTLRDKLRAFGDI